MKEKVKNIAEFEKLFREYFNPLVNYINSKLHNWEDSREVVQQTFYKIWKNKDKINIHSEVKGYLYQSCRNTMIDFVRARKSYADVESYENHVMEENESVLDPFVIRNCILSALKKQKPRMQEIFKLSKFEGLTYQEIADRLNISKRTVEDNIARALVLLKSELEKSEIYYE